MTTTPLDKDLPEELKSTPSDFDIKFDAVIIANYKPCLQLREANKLMSIQELYDLFELYFPNMGISKSEIVQCLIKNGFISHQSGQSVMWLMGKK